MLSLGSVGTGGADRTGSGRLEALVGKGGALSWESGLPGKRLLALMGLLKGEVVVGVVMLNIAAGSKFQWIY